jgi:hypothetical protein
MLVSIVALTAFILIVSQLVKSASTITTIGNKHMDADSQARSVLDRMAVDFAQMVKRSDVDFFGKNTAAPNSVAVDPAMSGNDQIAFFSTVPGYYPPSGSQSPISLVAYRVNTNSTSPNYNKLERMGKGLVWNGVTATPTATPIPNPTPTPYPAMQFLTPTMTISGTWPTATNSSSTDSAYELIGPYVFRFEYYYLIKGQTVGGTPYLSILSDKPFLGTTVTGHNAVNGFQDVSAIGVTIAIIDPQSRVLVLDDNNHLGKLIGQMPDFSLNMHSGGTSTATQPGDLDAQWQSAVNATTAVPRAAASAIHIYSRLFPIAH